MLFRMILLNKVSLLYVKIADYTKPNISGFEFGAYLQMRVRRQEKML